MIAVDANLLVYANRTDSEWLCLVHGVRELWTADRDFGRLPALATRNPLAEAE